MKKLLLLLLALSMALTLIACGGDKAPPTDENTKDDDSSLSQTSDLDYVKDKGELIIGYTLYAPMNYNDEEGNLVGFDTELATIVCERLGVTPKFQIITWNSKILELKGKTIDCIWNGMTILPEIAEATAITKPYVKNAQVVLVKEGTEYDTTASLEGKNIVAEQGSAGEATIAKDASLSKGKFIPKDVQSACLMEVKSGTADAAVLDLTLAKTMTGEGTNFADLKIVDRLAEESYGVAFRKDSNIRDEVNKLFDELTEDGTMATLAEKYGLDLATAQ